MPCSRQLRVSWRHSTLKVLEISSLIITSGSEGSELMRANMEERILVQWESPSLRPAVCKKRSYVDVKIREIGPLTAFAASEASMPAFTGDDGAYTTTVLGRFLKRKEKATFIFVYVGGVKVSKEVGQ
jgi:hypothetical protein